MTQSQVSAANWASGVLFPTRSPWREPTHLLRRNSAEAIGRMVLCSATLLVGLFLCEPTHAGLLSPGALLEVNVGKQFARFSFSGVLEQTLNITGLTATGGGTFPVPVGVAVVNDRLFIGVVNQSGPAIPRIAEINPNTGAVLQTWATVLTSMTSLGDNGVNLLLLDGVNAFDTYTYNLTGGLLSHVAMVRPFSGNVQSGGIDGDGTSIFTSYKSGSQPIVTNTIAGAAVTSFATNMSLSSNGIGGLAYDDSTDTFWVVGSNQFRNYSRAGALLNTVTAATSSGATGLEILPAPEPSSLVLFGLGAVALFLVARRNRRA